MGFLFVTLIFFGDKSRFISLLGGGFGLIYGFLIGAGRMVQGAHFATDVIWSLGVILLVAVTFHYLVLPRLDAFLDTPDMSQRKKYLLGFGAAGLAVIITLAFLTRRPFYETYAKPLELKQSIHEVIVESNVEFEKKEVIFKENTNGKILIHAEGFGWIDISLRIIIQDRVEGKALRISSQVQPKGYFSELNHQINLFLPKALEKQIRIEFVKSRE
jgi:hypothetical protein